MALSNNLTAILNLIAFLCSVPIIASGIWLAAQPDNECIHLIRWPVVLLGLLVLVVSLTGFVGAYWYKETLLAFYLCCMAILIALLLILLVFAFVVTRPDGSYDVPGRGDREFRIQGFSPWLRSHIVNSKNWGAIRACLAETDVCSRLTSRYLSADQFFAGHISPLQQTMTSKRGEDWKAEEDKNLCNSWVTISEDGNVGVNRRQSKFWDRVDMQFRVNDPNTTCTIKTMVNRMSTISKLCKFWN
ncbi:unnamed protein product [Linum tenue]|uniref:Tetraspanin-2 n=1 Tax=Linum tenue TaxID=586396 RepID=A0AAV0JA16_9ROSI|nr:unnamed protein product [Linum tenue]